MALSCNKNISGLLRGITSNHKGDFYYLNCLHSYRTKSKLKKHEKICKNHDFCHLKMSDAENSILKSKPGKKSLKHAFIIYADLECLLLKMNTCNNNPNKSCATAKALHKPSGYSLLTSCSFDKSENKQTYYRGKDIYEICHICDKEFCTDNNKEMRKVRDHCHYTGKYRGAAHS